MATKTNNAADNKVNAPANNKTNNNATSANAPQAPAIMDAATIAATAAAWLEKYASIRGIKENGAAVAAFNVAKVTKTDADGVKYACIERDGKASIDAATLAKINVLSAGKNGGRLLTLAEYNADLRK